MVKSGKGEPTSVATLLRKDQMTTSEDGSDEDENGKISDKSCFKKVKNVPR